MPAALLAIRRIGEIMCAIAGAPSYRRFAEHMLTRHPDREVPSRSEFLARVARAKAAGAKSGRCC